MGSWKYSSFIKEVTLDEISPFKNLPIKVKPGIERDKTMADKIKYVPNDDARNNSFCILQLVVETIGHST